MTEKKPFVLTANGMGCEEWHLGFDYFLSPEMAGLLKPKAEQATGANQYLAKATLTLDEHEQALG